MRYAHPEMQLAASELSILTSTLEHLHEILITGSPYAKPSFLNGVQEVLKNINSTIKEIQGMVSDKSIFRRLKWGKLGQLRSDIDKHKTTVAIQTSILSAAIVVKTITRYTYIHKCHSRFFPNACCLKDLKSIRTILHRRTDTEYKLKVSSGQAKLRSEWIHSGVIQSHHRNAHQVRPSEPIGSFRARQTNLKCLAMLHQRL